MAKRLGNLFSTKPQRSRDDLVETGSMTVFQDGQTVYSDQAQPSIAGGSSVAPTVHSQITLKASNKPEKTTEKDSGLKKTTKGWKKLKKLVGVKSSNQKSTKSERLSISSADDEQRSKEELDTAIRGRLDGIDSLSLGPANLSSFPENDGMVTITFSTREIEKDKNKDRIPPSIDFDPLRLSFTTLSKTWNPSDIVSDSVWCAGGSNRPELILEGFGYDRWTVRFDETPSSPSSASTENSRFVPRLQPIDDDESSSLAENVDFPSKGLWGQLWGDENKVPSPLNESPGRSEQEGLIEIAEACSVPVDLDEGSFLIDSPGHLRSVHEFITIPLQAQRFENALSIFGKLLKGLEQGQNKNTKHLVGSTHHNIGIVHLCLGNFENALLAFEKAVDERRACFSPNNPLLAVSLVRLGETNFALGLFNDALESFTKALDITPSEDSTRAKILNNIGVVHYQLESYENSLEAFISALEIQRTWLDGPVRRQPIVFDAAVTLGNMGKLYIEQGLYTLAYSVFEEAFMLQTSAFPKDHDIVLSTLTSMALVLAKNDQFLEALPVFQNIMRHHERRFGTKSEEYIEMMGMIGCINAKILDFEEAAKSLSKVLKWQKKRLSKSDPKRRMTKRALETVEDISKGKVSIWV
eukprot:scaffold66_cov115-Cylindrotheca_fusiformis.AAC.24